MHNADSFPICTAREPAVTDVLACGLFLTTAYGRVPRNRQPRQAMNRHRTVAFAYPTLYRSVQDGTSDVARTAEMTQSELSRLESRGDHRISTLTRYVEALGGELEVAAIFAIFGGRRVELTEGGLEGDDRRSPGRLSGIAAIHGASCRSYFEPACFSRPRRRLLRGRASS